MEFALIPAVALAGYLLRPADDTERDAMCTIEDDVIDVGTSINDTSTPSAQLDLHNVKAMKRFNDSFFPNHNNIIAPFYRSRAQTTNDTEKQKKTRSVHRKRCNLEAETRGRNAFRSDQAKYRFVRAAGKLGRVLPRPVYRFANRD